MPEGASTTSFEPASYPAPYLDRLRQADLGAQFAEYAEDALEWAEATLPVAGIHAVE